MIRFAVPVCAREHERYYPTPPHPHPEKGACVCWTARKMIRFAVPVCAQEHERYYPTPTPSPRKVPHPNPIPQKGACVCWTARKMIRFAVPVCAQEQERYYPTPPLERCLCLLDSKKDDKVCCACVCTGTRTLLPHPTTPHR